MIGEIKRDQADWDAFYWRLADFVGQERSKLKRRVGSVIVTPDRKQLSIGYNGFPPEIPDTRENLANPDMLEKVVHAERNCIQQCPFNPRGCTVYVTYFPCSGCAKRLIAAGIARVVAPYPDLEHPTWGESWEEAMTLLNSAGVIVAMVKLEEAP